MSNQLQITGGAKVRSLEGVITGTSGVLSSVPLGGANGVATLDSGGKVPVSQLPSSVVTYLGTWNAATNTPTLTNGTGDAGDMYICNVAGTVNFGAGPITFAVGDWVLYGSGTWQKSSGQNGTVTSVAVTESGNALTITGSPITTAGTINIGFAGSSSQYIAGDGTLVTFPTIITEAQNLITDVYNETGATLTKGTVVYINGGHGNLPTVTKAIATSDATSAQTYGVVQADITNNNNGHVVVIGSLGDLDTQAYPAGTQLYLSSTTAGAWTSTKQYAPAHLVYVGIVVRSHPTQGVVEVKIQNGFELDELHNVSAQTPSNGNILQYNSSTSLWTAVAGTTTNISEGTNLYYTDARARGAISLTTSGTSGAATYNSTTGVLNVPNYGSALSGYVPYTGATSDVNLGYRSISASNINIDGYSFGDGGAINFKQFTSLSLAGTGYTSIGANSTNILTFGFNQGALNLKGFKLDVAGLTTNVWRTYTMPNADGTLALTSDIPSLANYVTLTGSQTITGIKTFTNEQLFGNGMTLTGGYITYTSGSFNLTLNTNILTANRNVFLQDASGTIALLSDIPSLSGYVTGTGTTNTLPKFTGTSAIGNSNITDTGSLITFGSNSYVNGSLSIGSTPSTNINLLISKNISGSTTSYALYHNGTIQSDVATSAIFNATFIGTAAAAFTVNNAYGNYVAGTTIGAGSAISTQQAYYVHSNFTGATNNYGFRGAIPIGTGRFNLYMDGTANNYIAGALGFNVAGANFGNFSIRTSSNITGNASGSYGIRQDGTVQSDVTSAAYGYSNTLRTQATAFTLANYYHYDAGQATLGASSVVTNQTGFWVQSSMVGATNNYGFRGQIPAQTNAWNLYMDGTANNYLAGSLGIGSTSLTLYSVRVGKNITGGTFAGSVLSNATVQSDVTSDAISFYSLPATAAAAFTLTNLTHFYAQQSTIGAGSAVTNQIGFLATTSMTGATNNYGFYGAIASGTNRWNLYMAGSAANYLSGVLTIGTASPNASAKVQIDSTTQGFLPPRMTAAQRTAISTPATGLMVYQTDGTEGVYVYTSAGWKSLTMV